MPRHQEDYDIEEEKVMFLEIRGIRKSFGEGDSLVEVLKGIDLSVEKGEFCVLLGPSGSSLSRYFLWIF